MYKNLRHFLNALDKAGELKHIRKQVSSYLEISKLTDTASKSPNGGKALFFENVKGSSFPVVTNIFGSYKRICMALEVNHLDQLGARIKKIISFTPPKNLKEVFSGIHDAISYTKFFPKHIKSGIPACQEIIFQNENVDLSILPVLHCWPKDAGPFITLPLVFTKSPLNGKPNAGMYRMQIFDKNTTGMHWHIHKDGSHHYNEYTRIGKRMPVAVAVGVDPATTYAATAPLPRGVDEMLLSGFIREKPVKMAKCITVDLEVPAESEFVLEGYVDPGELRIEGPFGDHTGYYSLADEYPVFHVTALTHRKNPVYNATLVGRPPMEDCYLAKATERLFLPLIQTVMPEICDYWFPWEGVFHNIVVVAIEKEYPGHAQKIMSGLWGQGQMSFCKAIIVVDRKVNPQDPANVIKTLLTKLDISSDITITKGILDVLDHSSSIPNYGHKIGLDLTEKIKGETPAKPQHYLSKAIQAEKLTSLVNRIAPGAVKSRPLFNDLDGDDKIINRIVAITVKKTQTKGGKYFADRLLAQSGLDMFNIFILFDQDIDLYDSSLMLWKIFNNIDPGRDLIFKSNHVDSRVVIDACKKGIMDGHKREWPEELKF